MSSLNRLLQAILEVSKIQVRDSLEGCVGSIMKSGTESGIVKPCSSSGLVYCIHFHTNALSKSMEPSLLLLSMG